MGVRDTLAWLDTTTDPEIMREVRADPTMRRIVAWLDYLDARWDTWAPALLAGAGHTTPHPRPPATNMAAQTADPADLNG